VTLKHLVGLLQPDRGQIHVDGRDITHLSEEAYFEVRRLCGMVFQFPALLDSLSVYENMAFGLRAHRIVGNPQEERARIVESLRLVNLGSSVLKKFPAELSFGMRKRVSIARTVALRPSYLLFDEPTTSLDPVATRSVHDLIVSLSRELGVTSLVVSQDMQNAIGVADLILLFDNGRIVDQGTPTQMRASTHPLTRAFLRDTAA
jgi:phospholipid/cholesterol/gamma-HCH transport system ATP-binding protein